LNYYQKNALECWETKIHFKELVYADEEIAELLSEEELENIFSLDRYLENVDYIYNRIGI